MERTQKVKSGKSCLVKCWWLVLAMFLFPFTVCAEAPYETLWLHQLGVGAGRGAIATGIAIDGNDNIFVPWKTTSYGEISSLAKFDAAGESIWMQPLNIPNENGSRGIAFDKNSGYLYIIGDTWGFHGGYLAKYGSTTGRNVWVKPIDTQAIVNPAGIAIDSSGSIYVLGRAIAEGYTSKESVFLAKFNENGERLWVKEFHSAGAISSGGIALDTSGHVFISGSYLRSVEGELVRYYDGFIASFNTATGEKLWVNQLEQKDMTSTFDYRVVADRKGNVFATFAHFNDDGTNVTLMSKFKGDSGEMLWSKVLATAGTLNYPAGAVVDEGGNIVVSGASFVRPDNSDPVVHADSYIAKYSGDTGDAIWIKLMESPDWDDAALGVALDMAGNIYAAGSMKNDVYVAKFGPVPPKIEDLVAQFNQGVAAGSIIGSGPGKSANGRLKAVGNMLMAAQREIVDGNTTAACRQLDDIYHVMDGVKNPPDFVEGSGVSTLSADVVSLERSLQCPVQ